MNPIVSSLFALFAMTLIAKDWFTFRSNSKVSWTAIGLQASTILLFICILLGIEVIMPTKWLFKSFAEIIEQWLLSISTAMDTGG